MAKTPKNLSKKSDDSFEKNLETLEQLIDQLEKGELSLEESLQRFEQGISLARRCQDSLKTAEQKIEILSKKTATAPVEPFDRDKLDNE